MIVSLVIFLCFYFFFFFYSFFNKNKFNFFLEFHEKFRIDASFFENITKDIFFLKKYNGREKYIATSEFMDKTKKFLAQSDY